MIGILNGLNNCGSKDILILCSDGPTGLKKTITAIFSVTKQQCCIAHIIRNTLKYVANKDRKEFTKNLKIIYTVSNEKAGLKRLDEVTEKRKKQYLSAMGCCYDNWDVISTNFKLKKY
ncbi:MAG: transposase [Lachnospiraceae bacterium]